MFNLVFYTYKTNNFEKEAFLPSFSALHVICKWKKVKVKIKQKHVSIYVICYGFIRSAMVKEAIIFIVE